MRRPLAALAAVVVVVSPLAVAIPAQASGDFDMQDVTFHSDLNGCYIRDQGAGNQFVANAGSGTNCGNGSPVDLILTNKRIVNGITTWEIEDPVPFGCMNVSSSTGVFLNSCNDGQTTEMWISDPTNHTWENVHYGKNGFLSVDCGMITCPGTLTATASGLAWATPAS